MLLRCCTQYANKFGKLSSSHGTGKCQFSFQFWRQTMPKNVRMIQLHSFHMLGRLCSNSWDRFQQYVNWELPDVQVVFRNCTGTRDQIANICWITEKAREFQKNFCFIDYAKALEYVDHNKLWKIVKKMGIPDHLTGLLRNLCAGQEPTVRIRHRTTDWLLYSFPNFELVHICF